MEKVVIRRFYISWSQGLVFDNGNKCILSQRLAKEAEKRKYMRSCNDFSSCSFLLLISQTYKIHTHSSKKYNIKTAYEINYPLKCVWDPLYIYIYLGQIHFSIFI